MFWNSVLFANKMGNQIYYNSIFNWTILENADLGHLPFLSFIFAVFWKIFGYKLWVSPFLILPFIIDLFYKLYNFINHYI